jgi:hypothetical protein
MNKFFALFSIAALAFVSAACDKHSWEETQVLHEGMHGDHHGEGHGGDSHGDDSHGDGHGDPHAKEKEGHGEKPHAEGDKNHGKKADH